MIRSATRQAAVVGLGASLVWLDFAVNVAFPAIVQGFALAVDDIQWVVTCYVLAYTSLMLVFGRAGDIIGHARVFRLGIAWSAAALLLCALAPSYPLLLLCRVLQGVGAALVLSCGPALATLLDREERRSRNLGIYTMMMALGATLGPALGGVLVARWGWPAVFWFRVPLALAALLALGRLPAAPRPAAGERFDALGALLLVLALVALLLALNRVPRLSAVPLGLLAAALLFAFVRQERRAAQPILDLRVFRRPGFALLNLANLLTNLAGFAVWLLVPFYLAQTGGGFAASGALLAAASLGTAIAGPGGARLLAAIAAERLAVAAAAVVCAGLALIAAWDGATPAWALAATLLLQGIGIGAFQLAYTDSVAATLPRAERGVAGGLAMVTRTLGTLGAATLIMLLFRSLAAEHGFLPAFRESFALAALLPSAVAGLLAWRGRRR